jgi:hypothetical protein
MLGPSGQAKVFSAAQGTGGRAKADLVSRQLGPRPGLILCFSDDAAASQFLPGTRTWAGQAFHDMEIAVRVVELPASLREALIQAQRRQYR